MKQFKEITVCPHCEAETEERNEYTFCSDECGCLEGDGTKFMYVCPDCKEFKDDEKCDCKDQTR